MNDPIHNISDEDLKLSVSRLSHFSPSTTDEYGHQILDYILLDCTIDFGLTVVTPREIKTVIKKNLLVDFEEDEIVNSAKRLASKKFIKIIESTKKFEKPKFQILEKAEQHVSDNRASLLKLETEVLNEWKNEILEKYENHKDIKENIYKLVDILQKFTSKMFIKHGVETVSLLYPGENKIKSWLKDESNELLDKSFIPVNPFFDNIVKIEIPKFFQSVKSTRNHYISNLFNSSFYWHLIQVDDKCSKLLQKVTKGQKLFLDNNILYSIVGIHGKDALESAHSMLKFAKKLGYELNVTTKTLDEFQNTLKWHLKEARERPPVSRELAKIALEELGANNFLTVYWSELIKKGVSIEEFIADLSYIDDILEGLEISTFSKYRNDIENSEELTDEMSLLRKACGEHINLHIVEHDAFHRILITKLRKGLKYNFNDAKAWFLTHDHKLPQYSKHARNGKAHLPFCITTNEWIQINRPLLSRTISNEEFEESFHVLVTQSYVRSMLPTLPLDKAYNKILSKLERYSGMTPEVASRIASDTHFMVSILDIDDDEEINEKIESRLLDLNKELRRHNEELILEKKAEETKIDKLEKKVESISSQIEIEREKTRSIEQEKSNREKAFEKRIKELETGIETEKSEKKKLRDIVIGKEINEIVRIWKLPAYFSIIVIIIILAFIVMVFLFQDKEWNIVAKLFVWAESQSELRKEIFKWLLIMILGILQFLTVKFVWLRLFNKTAKKQHISEKLAEEQK